MELQLGDRITGYPSVDKPWNRYYKKLYTDSEIPAVSMYRLLYNSNAKRLNNIALHYFNRKITYGEFFENIDKLANNLSIAGIGKGDIVTILSLGTPETIYCIYALNKIGAIANLLTANISVSELESNLKKTKSKLLFILDKIAEKIGQFQYDIPVVLMSVADSMTGIQRLIVSMGTKRRKGYLSFKEFCRDNTTVVYELAEPHIEHNPAVIVYTSGSTGTPKGVVLSNKNLNSEAIMCCLSGKDYKPSETFLNNVPPFFSFGIGMLHLALYSGMKVLIALIPEVNNIIKLIKKYRPERYVMGPAFTDIIEKYDGDDLSFLIDLTGGGGAISESKEKHLNEILTAKHSQSLYLNGYGMTELSSGAAMNQTNIHKIQSIGIPLPLVNMKVINVDTGKEISYNEEGELLVNSPGVMIGYYEDKAATDKAIEIDINGERWLHTGDLARIDEDGFVFITGRIKRIYISRDDKGVAYKLFPQRMEEVLETNEGVDRAAVIVEPDQERINAPIVIIVCNKAFAGEEAVRQLLRDGLPEYYQPKQIVYVDKIPMNNSQKIDYKALEQSFFVSSEQ